MLNVHAFFLWRDPSLLLEEGMKCMSLLLLLLSRLLQLRTSKATGSSRIHMKEQGISKLWSTIFPS